MKTRTTIAIIAVTAALLTGSIFAQGKPGDAEPIRNFRDELELTDEQVDQLEELKYEHRLAGIEMRAELEKEKIEMEKLMSDDDFDRDGIYEQAEKVAELEKQLQLSRVEGKLDMMEILTQDQREKLREFKSQKMGMHRPGMGGKLNRFGACSHSERPMPGR